jgi:hypothetical protein
MTVGVDLVPLVVDLDGTLCRRDTLVTLARRVAFRRPHRLLGAAVTWGRGDRSALKHLLWRHAALDVTTLPLSSELLGWLAEEAAAGRPVYLATGAPQVLADALVAGHPLFAGAFGSREGLNLTGSVKARLLTERFGERGFDYVGNSRADLQVWRHARRGVLCNAPRSVARAARDCCPIDRELHARRR